MASSFLKKKAEAQAKKIDEKYGESAYGGSSTLRSGTQATPSAQTSVPTFNGGGGGSSTRTRASNFLTRKAREAAEGIDKEYGADQYGGSSWTALDKESGFNTWLDELTGFSSKVGEDYSTRGSSYQSADILGSYRDEKNTDIEVMLNRANIYKDYFSENMSYYDELYGEGTAAEILRSIDEGTKYLGDVRTDLDSEYNYWSQWETEDDYNGYLEQAAEYERLSSYNVEGGKSNLEVLEAQRSDLWAKKQAEQQKISAYSRAGNMLTQLKEAREAFASYDSQISALDDQISGLQQELQRAEDIQTANRYTAYMDEPDFSQYSKQGASIENPALADVEKGVTIFGWNPFAEKPNNIVTYSRDNWESIAMGEANNSQMTGRSLYHWMTDDEVNIYNYILSKQGNEAAQAYLDSIEETLNYRFGTMQAENIQNIGGVGEVLMTGLYGLGSGLDQFGTGVRQLFSSDRLPTTATQFGSAAIEDDLGGVGKVLYGGTKMVGNMAPGLLLAAVTAGAGAPAAVSGGVLSASVGASAGGNAYNQALGDGYTKEQARTYGSLVGLSEGALTYLLGGLGKTTGLTSKMLGKVASIDNALLRIAATGGVRIGGEVIEENLQNYLEPAFRTIIFNEDYDAPTFDDFVYTTLVTALTVGILEGGSIASAGRSQSTDLAVRDFNTDTIDGYLGEDGVDYFEGITDESELQSKYRELAKVNHPDVGGSEQTMTDINRQYAMRKAYYTVQSGTSAEQATDGSAPAATTQTAPPATAKTTGTQSDADLTVRLVREGVDRGSADSIASSIQSIVRGEEISGNKAAEIAQNEAAVTLLSELTGIEINTDAPISEVKTAIRNLASRTSAANRTGGDTDTPDTNEAQERIRRGYASKGERTVAVQAFDTERIGEIADTLGKAGAKALTSMYDAAAQDAESYFEGMTAYYNAGKDGAKLSSVKDGGALTQAQKQAAYLAGQSDAQVSGKENVAASLASGYTGGITNTETEVIQNGGKEGNQSGSRDGERTYGVAPAEPSTGVSGGTEKAQSGAETQRRRAESLRAAVQAQGIVSQSTAGQGISTGTNAKTLRVIPSSLYTPEMQTVAQAQKASGRAVTFFAGEMELNGTDGTFRARGAISADGKRIWVRADHDTLTVEQISKHEEFHALVKKDPELMRRTRDELIAGRSEAELLELVNAYIDWYGWSDVSIDYVLEEVLADAYAGIDVFEELSSYEGATRFTETTQKQAKRDTGKAIPQEKFSMDKPVEETKDLIALHNLTAEKLWGDLRLGGFPMPSIAVTKTSIPHTNFGDITLVMDKSTIDPKMSKKNTVYSADAWTPTFPRIEYEADPKVESRISKLYYELAKKGGYDLIRPMYDFATDLGDALTRAGGVQPIIERLRNDTEMMQVYLVATGIEPVQTIMRENVNRMDDDKIKQMDFFVEKMGADVLNELRPSGDENPMTARKRWIAEHGEKLREVFGDWLRLYDVTDQQLQNSMDAFSDMELLREFALPARNYLKTGPETRETVADTSATKQAILEKTDQDAYYDWLASLFAGAEKSKGIYNNKEIFTSSGNRKSFQQTHYPATLDGIVKAMAGQNDGNSRNVSGFYGVKSLRAGTAKRFSSIKEMHELEGRLRHLTEEEASEINDALSARLTDLMQRIYDTKKHGSYENSFMAMDAIGSMLMETAELKTKTVDSIGKICSEYQYALDNGILSEIRDLLFDVAQMPVNIYEAKPERSVGFDEVLAAIVPDSTETKLVEALKEAGVNDVRTYPEGDDDARVRLANSVEGAKFSQEPKKRDKDAPVSQGISSAKTSIKQVPALFKDKNTRFGDTNIDIGGGRFDLATDYLASIGTQNMVFDPYNRTAKENTSTLSFLRGGERADTATCANVLNVIAEPAARANVILETAKAIKPDGTAYFMVYEGDGSGTGKETSAGWQNNRKTADYLSEIGEYFDSVQKKGKLIIATEPKKDLPKAAWEITPGEAVMFSRETSALTPMEMEQKLNDLRQERDDVLDEITSDFFGELSESQLKKLNNRLTKLYHDIDVLVAEEGNATVKTPLRTIRDNLGKYRRSDLESLAEQISDGNWDGYEELSRFDLEFALAEELDRLMDDMNVLEAQAPKYGLYVRPFPAEGYSAESESVKELREQNEALRGKVDYWKQQTKRTDRQTLRQADLDKLARSIIKGYDSELDVSDIRKELKELGEYIVNGEQNGDELTYSEVKRRATSIARDVIENAYELVNNDEAETYRDIKAYFRGTYLSFEDKGDIADWADFRKRNFGRFTISKSGLPVDVAYQELTGMFGESYFPSEITHPTDQLLHIADLFDNMRPVYENPHSYYMAEAIEYCANEIIDGLISEDVRQTPPTFADRQAAKLGEQKAKDRQKLNDLREQKNERIGEIRREESEKRQEQVSRLREQKNARIEEIKTAGRERAKQAVGKERARRLEQVSSLKEHYRTKEEKARQSRRASALRNKIMRHVKDLSGKLLKPSDKNHIPESLRAPVASLLNSINLESKYTVNEETGEHVYDGSGNPTKRTEAFTALRAQYRDIEEGRGDYSLVIDPDLMDNLDAVIEMKDVRLADMNVEQLYTIWQTIRAIEASVASANKMLGQSRYETISEMADALRQDYDGFKTKQNRSGFIGGVEKFISIEMLKPVDYMHRLGRAGDALWQELRTAQDSYVKRIAEAERDMKAVIGNADMRDWGGKKAPITTFTTESGDSIDLTPAQVMELYLLMQRPQALQHILKGGIRQATVERKGGKLSEGSAPAHVTINDLAKIIGTLTAEQTRIADELGKYASGVLSGWGNEASMNVYGYRKFTEDHYWPIRSDPSYTKSESGKGVDVTIKGRGFTKQTVQHANNAIMIGDALDTFAQHVNDMATYSSWLAAIEDAERLKNFRYRNGEGDTVGSVKETINRVLGSAGTKYLDLLIEDINQGVKTKNDSFNLSRFTANYKAAAVGANLRVIVQQPTAILRAAAVIDPKYLAAGALRKSNWELVKKWAPIAQWKDWGYFELDNGRLIKDIILGTDSTLDRVRQAAMTPAGKADSITWGKIWTACEAEILATRKELKDGTDEFYEAVADRFNEVIDRSQVVDGILQRNQTMRSSSDLVRMATSFMSEPVTSFSMLSSALYDATHAQSEQARGKARKRLARTLTAVLMADVLCAAVASLIDALRDDGKEKDYWQKWAEAFTGITGDEESFTDYINAILSGNLGGQVNLLAKIPFVEDIFSLLQGYSITRMDMDSVQKLFQSVQRTIKALSGKGTATVGAALADLIANAARLWGLPVYNVKRDLTGALNTTLSAIGNWELMYKADKLLYSVDSSDNKGHYYDIAFYAWQEDDKTQCNAICADLISHGYTQKDIDSAIRSRLKKTEQFTDATGERLEGITADLESSSGFKGLPADYQTKALEAASDYATATTMREQNEDYELPTTYSWVDKADAGASVGIETWEYILFRTALQMADDDGSLKQEEVIDALEGMSWLSDEERDYLFGTRYESDKNNPWA